MKVKKIISLFFVLSFSADAAYAFVSSPEPIKPLLVVLLMVKDEAEVIIPTLETYVSKTISTSIKAGVADDEQIAYVLYDTGSTDGTEIKAKEFFVKQGIKYFVIVKEPFVDYSTSRNRGLAIAEEAFPEASFILFPDAEWYLSDFDALVSFCQEHKSDDPALCACYNLHLIDSHAYSFCSARLMRTQAHVRFMYRVHEIPVIAPCGNLPEHIYIKYAPKQQGNLRTQKRWLLDIEWLLADLAQYPQNKRITFLLGQTYQCLLHWDNACKYYRAVTEDSTIDEYTYLAYHNLGEITQFTNHVKGKNSERDWYEAFHYYLKAFSVRPHRAEPLVNIANHYISTQDMALSYLFASRACKLSYPSQDVLFIDKNVYDFERYRLLGICAWHVGDYKAGEEALKSALRVKPGDQELARNLSWYQGNGMISNCCSDLSLH